MPTTEPHTPMPEAVKPLAPAAEPFTSRQVRRRVGLVIEPQGHWATVRWGELWRYRELAFFLALRDIKVRYKQTALGVAWAILQPLLSTAIFAVFFGLF